MGHFLMIELSAVAAAIITVLQAPAEELKPKAISDDSRIEMLTPPAAECAPDLLRASALKAADRLPLLSAVLHRAIGLLSQGDEVSISVLGAVIEEDVVITGSLLSIANSAFYSRNSRVSSVRRAIAQLGIRKTRNVLLGLTVSRYFNSVRIPAPWSSDRFNAHSLAVATLSDLLVQNVPSEDPDWAFMAGMLHDIGLPLIAVGLPEHFRAITLNCGNELQLIEREREILGFTHFDLGADLLARWNCPPSMQEATRFCESRAFSYEPPLKLGVVLKTASLLGDANGISTFESKEDGTVATSILDALRVPMPLEFLARFRMEYSDLQAYAA